MRMIYSQICIGFRIIGKNGEERAKENGQDEKGKLEH